MYYDEMIGWYISTYNSLIDVRSRARFALDVADDIVENTPTQYIQRAIDTLGKMIDSNLFTVEEFSQMQTYYRQLCNRATRGNLKVRGICPRTVSYRVDPKPFDIPETFTM